MITKQLSGRTLYKGFPCKSREQNGVKKGAKQFSLGFSSEIPKGLGFTDAASSCCLSAESRTSISPLVIHRRRRSVGLVYTYSQSSSGYGVESTNLEGKSVLEDEETINGTRHEEFESGKVPIHQQYSSEKPWESTKVPFHQVDIKRELIMLSLPAMAGQAIDPFTQLMETAYIGRLGPVELGSAGVASTVFNNISKLFNVPLFSVATSFVAEDISKSAINDYSTENNTEENGKPIDVVPARKQLSSVSTALFLAVVIGLFEALALSLGSGPFLNMMGVSLDSPMRIPAQRFLVLRALGAPAFVLSLALQGVFRGFKDTTTPVYSLAVGNFSAIFLFPLLMYYCKLGVTGAAISTVISQYITAFLMMWHLNKKVVLLPPKMGAMQFGVYMKSGGFLIGRTFALLTTTTLATSMAARQGPEPMAAHQICMQVWLAVSLLTDALAASAQAIIASYASKGDYKTVKEVTSFVLKIGLLTGVVLAAILGVSFSSIATLFTKDAQVLGIVQTGILFVSASQPLNALAFIFDGLHYGVSDFPYAACSMMLVGVICSAFLLYAPTVAGLNGVWSGLALFMALRTAVGFFRLLSKSGPWWFMHKDLQNMEAGQ